MNKYRVSLDALVPSGKIIMAFTDPDYDDKENPYKYFTDDFIGDYIHTYYAFDTVKDFINKWVEIYDKPNGMWYWVMDGEHCVCSGACDPMDIEIFLHHWTDCKDMITAVVVDELGLDNWIED